MNTFYKVFVNHKEEKDRQPKKFQYKEDALIYAKNTAKRVSHEKEVEVVEFTLESLGVLKGSGINPLTGKEKR